MKRFAFYVVVLAITSYSASSMAAQFYNLGYAPTRTNTSTATGVSDDGSIAVGYSSGSLITDTEGFIWSMTDGTSGISDLPGGVFYSEAKGVSGNGSVVVGRGSSYSGAQAIRWTPSAGMGGLGYLPGGSYSVANGISGDGSVIVGESSVGSNSHAFNWTSSAGMVDLGTLAGGTYSSAKGVSYDGTVVVGQADSSAGYQAFRWNSTDGMVSLGFMPGDNNSTARMASADGSVIVGESSNGSNTQAFRWTSTDGMMGLGHLPGGTLSSATGVSGDGSVIVGVDYNSSGSNAFIWDSTAGMRDLKSVLLSDYGLDLSGWTLYGANAVSSNGRAIAGYGINPSGSQEAWLVLLDPLQLNWQGTSSGNWDTISNWDFAHPATYMTDVSINPDTGMTITGPAGAATIKSLNIGTVSSGIVTLKLQESGSLNVNVVTIVGNNGKITGNGTLNAIGGIVNSGEIDLGASSLQLVGGTLSNSGVVRGSGYIANGLQNNSDGRVSLSAGQRMIFSGASNSNAGSIEALGNSTNVAEMEFKKGLNNLAGTGALYARNALLRFGDFGLTNSDTVDVSFGTSDIFGNVTNNTGGQITLSGNSQTTFYDNVINNGTLKVSKGSTAVIYGDLEGSPATGAGTVYIEGSSTPSVLGGSLYLAGTPTSAGSDMYNVTINNDSSDGLYVSGTDYHVGAITGSGTTTVYNGGSITTKSLRQKSLIIGGSGPLAAMHTIAVVPEPSSLTLIAIAGLSLLVYFRRLVSQGR